MRSTSLPFEVPLRKNLAVAGIALMLLVASLLLLAAPSAQAATLRLDGVRTTLTTDPATTSVLFGAGIIPLPVAPTPIVPTADAARYTFPVTGGAVDSKTLAGSILHSGGLLLAQRDGMGWKALSLTKFTIRINDKPGLTAIVNGGDRVRIADLDLGSAKIDRYTRHGRAFVSIGNVGVTLNATAMGAINSTFGTTLPDEVKLGTAKVLARVAH